MSLRFLVSDLLAKPGHQREVSGSARLDIHLSEAAVAGDVELEATVASLTDGVIARGRATAMARLVCDRCLTERDEPVEASIEEVFRLRPEGEDESRVEPGGWIDLEQAVHDEVALALPLRPLCRPDCRGLCPTCGTDLNTDPCAGHGDEPSSPFTALKQLFEP